MVTSEIETNEILLNPKHQVQPPKETLNRGQIELYKYLKQKYDEGEGVRRSEIMELYAEHVRPHKYQKGLVYEETTINTNVSVWLNGCIAAFVRRGYVCLSFNFGVDEIEEYHGSLMGNRRKTINK